MNSILVVCEGNICRSPMAFGLLAKALPNTRITSAGLGALVGHPADPIAIALMRTRGVDISDHRATQINRDMCLLADLIFVMETEQQVRLVHMYPQVRGRVFQIAQPPGTDVPDPYGKPEQAFVEALQIIDASVQFWNDRIRKL